MLAVVVIDGDVVDETVESVPILLGSSHPAIILGKFKEQKRSERVLIRINIEKVGPQSVKRI